MLGQIALTGLHNKGVNSDTVVAITKEISRYGLTACIGQHRDIRHSTDPSVTEDEYLKSIAMKSAAQVECAARTGAMIASEDRIIIDNFTAFGHNLGMAAQIVNDIMGVTTEDRLKNDIATASVTMPVIYALANADKKDKELLRSVYGRNAPASPEIIENMRQVLYSTGAIQYAVVLAETYRQKAFTALNKARNSGADVDMLENLLSQLEPR
jgi:geranylgeranyl diphosphate synthase type I